MFMWLLLIHSHLCGSRHVPVDHAHHDPWWGRGGGSHLLNHDSGCRVSGRLLVWTQGRCHLFGGHSCLQMRGQVFPEGLLRHLTVPEQILNISSKQGKERMNFHAFLQEVFGNSRCSIRSLTNAKVHICLSVNPEAAPWVGPSPAPPSSPGHSRCWFSLAPSRLCSEESTAWEEEADHQWHARHSGEGRLVQFYRQHARTLSFCA